MSAPAKTIDRLPVIPNRENSSIRMSGLQRRDQTCRILRNVLEFINEHMSKRSFIVASRDMISSPKHHVFEVNPRTKFLLIAVKHRSKSREE